MTGTNSRRMNQTFVHPIVWQKPTTDFVEGANLGTTRLRLVSDEITVSDRRLEAETMQGGVLRLIS